MTALHAVILGIVQGVAEFLPISSSGHLAIAQELLKIENAAEIPPFYDVLLHLGTLTAVFAAYWGEIREMLRELLRGVRDMAGGKTPVPVPPARRMILLVIVGTLPLFAVLPAVDWIEGLGDNLYVVGCALMATGVLLWGADRVKQGRKSERSAAMTDALVVGAAQALATCPGLSRSGTTIAAGCFLGFERSFALRYSFILSIPAVLGANLLSLIKVLSAGGVEWGQIPVYSVGVVTAAAVGYGCIRLLKMLARKGRFGAFAWYCLAMGALTLILTAAKG